jgi:hypothetical protein
MDLRFKDELVRIPDLHHRLRQMRWFRTTFRANARAVASAYGVRFEIDEPRLTAVFLDWIEAVEADKRFAAVNRADFIVFAAGIALRELVRRNPAAATPLVDSHSRQDMQHTAEIVRFWPEGFLYTNYCVAVVAAVYEQEFGQAPTIDTCADDLRFWWSYRENVAEMPAYAIAFLDRLLGAEPNWIVPHDLPSRSAMRRSLDSLAHGGSVIRAVVH